MSQRDANLSIDEYFHLYNRGNSKQLIFKSGSDYRRFMSLLFISNGSYAFKLRDYRDSPDLYQIERGDPLVAIGAYCLMPNHFHILVKPLVEGGISVFMKKLATGYSMYFNRVYERTGTLFEGRYKSKHVDSDEYLKYLYAYIHLNPLKLIDPEWRSKGLADIQGGREYLMQYSFSSYPDFVGKPRRERVLISNEHFPQYFKDVADIESEMGTWMKYQELN